MNEPLDIEYGEVLPFKKSLLKALAKQLMREQKALNNDALFKAINIEENESSIPFKVFERPEFNPARE